MDEIATEQVFESVLVRVMGVGTTIEFVRRRILPTLLITSVLKTFSMWKVGGLGNTYTITLFIEHEGSDGPASVGMIAGLASNSDSGAAPAILILSAGDGTSGHWHGRVSSSSMGVEITEWLMEGTTDQWCSLYPFPVRIIAEPERTDYLTQLRVQPHSHHRDPPLLLPISQ